VSGHGSLQVVIARSEATKQSRLSPRRQSGLLRCARNDYGESADAYAYAYAAFAVTIQIAPCNATD